MEAVPDFAKVVVPGFCLIRRGVVELRDGVHVAGRGQERFQSADGRQGTGLGRGCHDVLPAPVAQVDAAAIRHEERGLELFRGFFPAIGKKGALARFLPQGREGLAGKLGEALGFVFPCGGRNGERDGGSLFNGVEGGGETHGAQGEGKVRRGRGVRQEG